MVKVGGLMKPKFEGWDYTELAKAWKISTTDGDKMLEKMRMKISLTHSKAKSDAELRSSSTYKDCRAYLKAHIAYCLKSNWCGPDYANYMRGIQKARDPYIFLDLFSFNLARMWV
jgi:hypothetical protein